jgi:hypothetical protein
MAAVPIYVWNGTAWQETGPTIPANPIKYQASAPSSPSTGDIWVDSDGDVTTGSQQFQRFRFVASGGETTISGADANGAVLAYTAGLEQVVLNGAVLVRGHDYTATTGTTITGLSPALVASDVLEVFSFIAFTVANTYTQSQVDGLLAGLVGPAFSATCGSLTLPSSGAATKMPFSTEVFDTNNNYDPTTNYRFTPTVAGYYLIQVSLFMGMGSGRGAASIYKSGSLYYERLDLGSNTAGGQSFSASAILYLNGTTDYVEAYASQSSGGNVTVNNSNTLTQFHGCMIRKA